MKNIQIINIIALFLLLFGASCHKDQPNANLVNLPKIVDTKCIFCDSIQNFSGTQIGNNWKYIVYDSLRRNVDTQTVVISGETTLSDGRMSKIVKSYYSISGDTTYTYLVEDASMATFYTTKEGSVFDKSYVYPLKIGTMWKGWHMLDTLRVDSKESIIVPAGNFSAYTIHKYYRVTNTFILDDEWYCPGIGMIQRNYRELNFGPVMNKTFRLISYNFVK